MKPVYIILTSISLVYLCSCDNGKAQKRQQEAAEKARIDSLETIRLDSLSQFAWGDVKFGISVNEAKTNNIFNNENPICEKNSPFCFITLYNTSDKINIRGVFSLKASFFNNRLYEIKLESYSAYNTNDKELVNTSRVLHYLIKEKFGDPTRDTSVNLSLFESRNRESMPLYYWEIGHKHISINIEKVFQNQVHITCLIIHNIENVPVEAYNKKLKEETESKRVNSF